MKALIRILLFALFIIFLSSCVPKSDLEGTWQSDMETQTKLSMETKLFTAGKHYDLIEYCERQPGYLATASNAQLNLLSKAYSTTKQYDKLFECFNQMEANYKNGDKYVMDYSFYKLDLYAEMPFMKGGAYLELGQYEKAIQEFKKGLKYSQASPYHQKSTMVPGEEALVIAYAYNNEKEKAYQLLEKIVQGYQQDYQRSLDKIYQGKRNRGIELNYALSTAKMYMALKDYKMVYETLAVEFPPGSPSSKDLGIVQISVDFLRNKALFELGRFSEAENGYRQLLRRPEIQSNGFIYQTILFDLGRIAYKAGNLDQAIGSFSESIEVIEQQRSTIHSEIGKIGFVGDKQAVYQDIVSALFENQQYAEAFVYAERAKARALVDMLAAKKQFSGGEIRNFSSFNDLLNQLDMAEKKAMAQSHLIPSSQQENRNVRGIIVQKRQELAKIDRELASLVTVSRLDISELQGLLPPDETLVEYFGSEDALFAFIVNRSQVWAVKLDVTGVNKEIETFRKQIILSPNEIKKMITKVKGSNGSGMDSVLNTLQITGDLLYQKLIYPIKDKITSNKITIVPHGALHYLPFCALHSDKGYLLDQFHIRILPSASVLPFLRGAGKGHTGELIVFGNPDLGDPLYDLPYAQAEALTIAEGQPNSKILIRKQATETRLKKWGNQFKFVHFACHGVYHPETPMESSLLLSGDNENDGTLSVAELYDLKLNADLVTLSACETALGEVANGDDVVGFSRGFLYAGANAIVSSLWKVDDEATSILMKHFYRSLKEKDIRAALRSAQLEIRKTYCPHPYFWAAFQLTGGIFGKASPAPTKPAEKQTLPSTAISKATEKRTGQGCRLSVTSSHMTLNGQKVSFNLKINDIIKILGKPSRIFHKKNILNVYDDIGLVVYQIPNTKNIITLSLFYCGDNFDFMPKRKFTSKLMVEDKIITPNMSIDSINSMYSTFTFVQQSIHSVKHWKSRLGKCQLFISYTDNALRQMGSLSICF